MPYQCSVYSDISAVQMYYIQLLLKIRSFLEQEILITFCIAQGHRKIPVACSPKSAIDYQCFENYNELVPFTLEAHSIFFFLLVSLNVILLFVRVEQIPVMVSIGNTLANTVWEANLHGRTKPTPTSPREEKEQWIKDKYVDKLFIAQLPYVDVLISEVRL